MGGWLLSSGEFVIVFVAARGVAQYLLGGVEGLCLIEAASEPPLTSE